MSPWTPQQNNVVEQGFATLHYRMRAMITYAGLHKNLKTDLWTKYSATATKLEKIMVNPQEAKWAHENFYEKILDYTKYLRTLGEMGVVRSIATVKQNWKIRERRSGY